MLWQQQLMKCDLDFSFPFLLHQNNEWRWVRRKKWKGGKKQIGELRGTTFMVITISCQQRGIQKIILNVTVYA